jgi:hypothetical protein
MGSQANLSSVDPAKLIVICKLLLACRWLVDAWKRNELWALGFENFEVRVDQTP